MYSATRACSPASSVGSHTSGISHPPGSRKRRQTTLANVPSDVLLDSIRDWDDGRASPVTPPEDSVPPTLISGDLLLKRWQEAWQERDMLEESDTDPHMRLSDSDESDKLESPGVSPYFHVRKGDGPSHCPFVEEGRPCAYLPSDQLDGFHESRHNSLKVYHCEIPPCVDYHLAFCSNLCLSQHKRKPHLPGSRLSRNHEPHFCTFEGCRRSSPGNGFYNEASRLKHESRRHGGGGHKSFESDTSSRKRKADGSDTHDDALQDSMEHKTAANNLLMWPSLTRLLEPYTYHPDFAKVLEDGRNLSIMHGIPRVPERTFNIPLQPLDDAARSVRIEEGDKPNHAAQSLSMHQVVGTEIDESGFLWMTDEAARQHYQQYLEFMHRMHPFLDREDLDISIENFIRCFCSRTLTSESMSHNIYTMHALEDVKEVKSRANSIDSSLSRPVVEKNISNAIVLLVLALGAICGYKSHLPDMIVNENADYHYQYIPTSKDHMEAAMNHQSITRESATGNKEDLVKGLRTHPGISLYGFATKIIESISNEDEDLLIDLRIQAYLLAGLYAGQLGYSWKGREWIHGAARDCRGLAELGRYDLLGEDPARNFYSGTCWTSLLLDVEFAAPLGPLTFDHALPERTIHYPKIFPQVPQALANDDTTSSTMKLFYRARVYLYGIDRHVRSNLARIAQEIQLFGLSNTQLELKGELDLWRRSLPDVIFWDDNEPASSEFNTANLRAKYYGIMSQIHQPMLYFVLHNRYKSQIVRQVSSDYDIGPSIPKTPSSFQVYINHGMPPSIKPKDMPFILHGACTVSVDSAIHATEAFDRIGHQLFVSNILGTGHALFEAMLIIVATYNSSLSSLVDISTLRTRLERTLKLLLRNGSMSPTLRADAKILAQIYETIFTHSPTLSRVSP